MNWEKLEYILNFINRQKAIIEKSEKVEQFADKTIETANAEIERLNIELQSMRSAANSYKMHYEKAQTEIERLQKEIEVKDNIYQRNIGLRKKRIFDLIDELKKAKSEAIKEFEEELEYFILNEDVEIVKPKCKYYGSYINGANQFRHQIKNGIKKLVKEMEVSE